MRVLLLSFLCASSLAAADDQTLAYSKAWLRLLHYQATGKGYKSELDGKEFFFAPEGRKNPLAELRASRAAFHQDLQIGRLKIHPQCAFPARFQFVRKAFNDKYKIVECQKFADFLKLFHNPNGVTLVFSSAYPNNPASIFGHTFLKFRSERKNNLIDTGINFAAFTPPGTSTFDYIFGGMAGGFPGMWSLEPYFTKVNEYVNSESRDLWEYDLNFSQQETLDLLAHIWELEVTSHFDYYFFDKNCSYQILRALEAVKVDWNISQHNIYVIPAETVKRVADVPGAVREVHIRPSLFHQSQLRHKNLDEAGRKNWTLYLKGQEPGDLRPEVLDATLTSLLYRKAQKKKEWSAEDQKLENRILELRIKDKRTTPDPEVPTEILRSQPDLSHDPYAIYLSSGYLDNDSQKLGAFGRFKIRSAYHDLMANDAGFTPFSEVTGPTIQFQFHDDNWRVQEFTLMSTTSLFPLSPVARRMSWRLRWQMETERGRVCQNCLLQTFEGGGGFTLGESTYRLYTLLLGRAETHHRLDLGYRLRPTAEVGGIWNPLENYKTSLIFRHLRDAVRHELDDEVRWDHSITLSRNQELRQMSTWHLSEAQSRPSWVEIEVQWIQYFR